MHHRSPSLSTVAAVLVLVVLVALTPAASAQNMTVTEEHVIYEWDGALPILVWGVLLIWLLTRTAWFPAIATLLALGNDILPTSLWALEASVMFVTIALILHVLAVSGMVPGPFNRNRNGE